MPVATSPVGSPLQLLLLSGSLRHTSSNSTALLRAASVGRDLFHATAYTDLSLLPGFNPDIEELGEDSPRFPAEARRLRELVMRADALLVSTPEYAHGLPGAFKNALDWLVGGSGFPGLPCGLVNVSSHSRFASPQFLEIARTMSGIIVADACVVLDRHETPLGARDDELHPGAASVLRQAMEALHAAARRRD
jgi:chromate reductase, NAD(P)H dehydrogenase (quinone)